jgi:prepilin-type N-terminal cleavage/methylation domain-containing protein
VCGLAPSVTNKFIFKENVKMTKAIKNNSKKGFTLVELVVVIAILAILAAIAIPVVNSIINTASKNGALSDAQTIELAIKECQADIAARNDEVYDGRTMKNAAGADVTINKASTGHANITLQQVAVVKGIEDAFKVVTYNGVDYAPYWDTVTDSCIYLSLAAKTNVCEKGAPLDAPSTSGTATPAYGGYSVANRCVMLVTADAKTGTASNGVSTDSKLPKVEAL